MKKTKIEWTESSWNPTIGCTKISSGCKNCYAESMARRLKAMGNKDYKDGFKFKILPQRLNETINNSTPTMYFVNSMSDLFHEDIPLNYLNEILNVIETTPRHTYQVLTKRAKRMRKYFDNRRIPNNLWIGVTVEDKKSGLQRIDLLRDLKAPIKFLSCEPLLEDLGIINLIGINWVIVGGESGKSARPIKEEWIINIKKQCDYTGTDFFFKQWGAWGEDGKKRSKKVNGNNLLGKKWEAIPATPFK